MVFKNMRLILFTEFLYLHPQVERMAYTFQGFFSLSWEKAEAHDQRGGETSINAWNSI